MYRNLRGTVSDGGDRAVGQLIKGQGPGLVNVPWAECKNDKFLIRLFASWSFKEYDLAHVLLPVPSEGGSEPL